jgi:hypothetical protein
LFFQARSFIPADAALLVFPNPPIQPILPLRRTSLRGGLLRVLALACSRIASASFLQDYF